MIFFKTDFVFKSLFVFKSYVTDICFFMIFLRKKFTKNENKLKDTSESICLTLKYSPLSITAYGEKVDDRVYRWVFKDYFLNFTLSHVGRRGGGGDKTDLHNLTTVSSLQFPHDLRYPLVI